MTTLSYSSNLVIFRLNPAIATGRPTCSMFDIRDATGAQLVTGRHNGDDYLVVETPE